jgi:hypothetical protein
MDPVSEEFDIDIEVAKMNMNSEMKALSIHLGTSRRHI